MSAANANGWTVTPLGMVLHRRREELQIKETESYKRVTIRLNSRGVIVRNEAIGAEIGTKRQFRIRSGQFILSKIDARNGAFGVVSAECDNAIITGNFWTFEVDPEKLDARYFYYLTRTPLFIDFCIRASEGTTNRRYLQENRFLAQQLRLPPLSVQRRIVAKIERLAAKIDEARGISSIAATASKKIIAAATSRIFESLKEVPREAIGRLGIDGANPVQTGPFGAQLHSSEFTIDGIPVLNVGNVWPEGLRFDRLDHVTEEKAQQLERYHVKPGDLLFARSGATLGKVCLVPETCDEWLMTGHLFRVRFDSSRCEPQFAFVALRGAKQIRDQVFGQVRGATRPGFNTTLLSRVELPLPSPTEQRRIVAYLDGLQAKVDELKRLQAESAAELDALLPAILDRAFKGEL